MSTQCIQKDIHETEQEENLARQRQEEEWAEIEALVMEYQKQFEEEPVPGQIDSSQQAAEELLNRFNPLFRKYITLLRSGQIDFNDKESKLFVSSFVSNDALKRALRRKKQKAEYRAQIYQLFNFIKETYGTVSEEEMMTDLQSILLVMARRYKKMGKSFCAYIYNSYRYEVARYIKKFIRNPLNIPYKNVVYEDYMRSTSDQDIEEGFEDRYYEDTMGMPDMSWIRGLSCSEIFASLSPLERKLLTKYYLEEWNDRQISEEFGIHINTVNQKRREAATKVAHVQGLTEKDIKRNRKSGKRAVMTYKI